MFWHFQKYSLFISHHSQGYVFDYELFKKAATKTTKYATNQFEMFFSVGR